MRKFKEKLGTVPCPGWLFSIGVVVYCEVLLHIWITEDFLANRVCGILLFALGFGGLLGQIASFIGHKTWGKWVTVAITGLVSVFYIVEFFVSDAYQTFMPLSTLLSGAKGVATDFADVVVDLVVADFWRIIVILLPVVLFALFACPTQTNWRSRWIGLALTVAAYLAGFAVVLSGQDADRMSTTYNFDSAIRVLGLNMTMTLDAVRGSEEAAGDFVMATPAPVEESEPVQEQPEAVTGETVAETEPIVYGDNIIEALDFAALIEEESNSRIDKIHQYVSSSTPTQKNEYTGLFAGKNLIVITAEAFAAEVIDPERTPTLYRLANEGIKFNDFYQPMWGGSTSSGEYSVLTGLVSASGTNSVREAIQQDLFLCIGKQLQKQGYFSAAYHNHLYTFYDRHETHTNFGYDTFIGLNNGMEEGVKEQWPESDLEMIDFTVSQYIDQQPFSIYYMTVSGHCRYNWLGNKMSKKNKDVVLEMELDYSETVQAYLASQMELEYALESLVRQLEEAGIADDTVIVLTADHYPYGLEKGSTWSNKEDYIGELYGYKYENIIQRDHNALIIWSGCIEDMDLVVDEPVYSLDILPTISNLFGVEYDSRLLVGRDVFSDAEPIVLWYDHTWKTDKGYYDSSTGKFTPAEGVEVDEAYIERIKTIVSNKIYYSREVASTDYFNYLSEALGYQ